MHDIFQGSKAHLMVEYENQFMTAIATQLRILYPQDPRTDTEVCRGYRRVLTCVDAVSFSAHVLDPKNFLYGLERVLYNNFFWCFSFMEIKILVKKCQWKLFETFCTS